MKISFVIPAFNEEAYVGKCLQAIFAEIERSKTDAAEVMVVNNASTDQTAQKVREFPLARLVEEKEKGIVRARRRGFLETTGELVANIDSDVILTPGWLTLVFQEFAQNPRLVCLSGPFLYYDLPGYMRLGVKLYYLLGYSFASLYGLVTGRKFLVQGGNFVVLRSALAKAGGYDAKIEFYGEDTDVGRRLAEVGEVKFSFKLAVHSSGRRLAIQGPLKTAWLYILNYFWVLLFHRPRDYSSRDFRPNSPKD